jgi:hypothetical protein
VRNTIVDNAHISGGIMKVAHQEPRDLTVSNWSVPTPSPRYPRAKAIRKGMDLMK